MARIKNQHTYSLINYEGATAVTDLSSVDNYSSKYIILASRVSQASDNIILT
jgi:hypothetical protein